MEALAGVTVIEVKVAFVTVKLAVPLVAPKAALIVVVPAEEPVAKPLPSIPANAGLDEDQVTALVILWLLPSE
jgi:hypothetical protein